MNRISPKSDTAVRSSELANISEISALEASVMDRQVRINRWFLAVAACATLAAGASFAEGRSASKSGEAASRASSTVNGPAANGGTGEAGIESRAGGKATGTTHSIDLVRPDDGYSSLHRRAMRSSLVAAGQKNQRQIVPAVAVAPRQPSPAGAAAQPLRNSAGVAMNGNPGLGKPDSIHTVAGAPVGTGLGKNSLGMSVNEIRRPETHSKATVAMPVFAGINGTTMGHAGLGGVGGPAKDRAGINGSAYRK
jgi:hypothetical protein